MKKKLFSQFFAVLICAVCLFGYLSLDVSATEIENDPTQATEAEQGNEPTADDSLEELYNEIESLREDVANKQQIIENNQAMIERYHDLYSTWTGIIAALLTIFGVIIPLLSPVIINRLNKRELKKDIDEFKAYSNDQYDKLVKIQNALSLSNQGEFWSSDQCFEKLLVKYPDDPYIKIYIARNSYRKLDKLLETEDASEHEAEIYKTINAYIDWFYETDRNLIEDLMIGQFYGDCTVLEVAMLISSLANCEKTNTSPDFIKTCKKACQYILDVLNVKTEEELCDLDQTDVCVMNYKIINFQMCEAYFKNKRIDTEQQLRKTIRLYSIDEFSQMGDDLEQCQEMLKKVLNKATDECAETKG